MAEEKMESMEDFKDELDRSFRKINEGDILTGTVISVGDEYIALDLKYYTQGIIRTEDLSDDPKFSARREINVGDEVTATVISTDDGKGNILLSRKEATQVLAWDKLKDDLEKKTDLEVTVSEAVKSGVVAFLEGIRGFIPASKLDLSYVDEKYLPAYVGKKLMVRVITADQEAEKLVMSAKEILKEKAEQTRSEKISNIEVGLVTEGTVESLQPYGAFIDLGNGISGLVHISQICNQRIANPASVLKVGEKVKVKVIAIKEGKLSLSMKALEDVAATEITEEKIDYKSEGDATTSLAALLKKAGF